MNVGPWLAASLAISVLPSWSGTPMAPDRALDDRIALERVRWEARAWPDGSGPKPRFDETALREGLRRRVESGRRAAVALERVWSEPVTAAQVQAEIDRMARGTRDAALLSKLWSALGNDPARIAESLALPVLARRLAESRYAHDPWLHTTLRAKAEARRERLLRGDDPHGLDGFEAETTRPAVGTDAAGRVTPLRETDDAIEAEVVLGVEQGHARIAVLRWEKLPFDRWLESAPELTAASRPIAHPAGGYRLPQITGGGACTPDTWRSLTDGDVGPAPTGVSGAATVWTGAELIVWSGLGSSGLAETGRRYDPALGAWETIATDGAPLGRSNGAAVWSGREMIVWSGERFGAWPSTGGRYDPVSDEWTPTQTTGAPVGRLEPTGVWTGSSLIVWGGWTWNSQGGFFPRNDGSVYTPSTDSWQATPLPGAPSARRGHGSVWDGTEMIVWGGSGPVNDSLMNGARFNPSTWSWDSMATPVGGWSSRPAIWTGARMFTGQAVQGYDPVSDIWTPTAAGGPPITAQFAVGHWSGERILFWGRNASNLSLMAVTYDPALDVWGSFSLQGSPTYRAGAVHAWTGTELLIFGGNTVGGFPTYLQDGALYCAGCSSFVTLYRDHDQDGHGDPAETTTRCGGAPLPGYVEIADDCDDGDAATWTVPGEVVALRFETGPATLAWDPPPAPGGGTPTSYDVLRSSGSGLWSTATCLNAPETSLSDSTAPSPGEGLFYLARARNTCGTGGWGESSAGVPRAGPACP